MKMNEFVSLKVGDDLLQKIQEQMKVDKRQSRSDMIRVLLEEGIEARELARESESVPKGAA